MVPLGKEADTMWRSVATFLVGFAPAQAPDQPPVPKAPAGVKAEAARNGDPIRNTPIYCQMDVALQRGAEWLCRANRADGRFSPGCLPALKRELEDHDYLRQVQAAGALGRAARYLKNERYRARAQQALLTLLADTSVDPSDSRFRHTTLPATVVDRIGAAGLLVWAIHELPAPPADLLQQAEQLTAYLAREQQADGAWNQARAGAPPEATCVSSAMALAGLSRGHAHAPAAWKLDALRRALNPHRARWKSTKDQISASWLAAAYAEAFLVTKEEAFAAFVMEICDGVCEQQYVQLDARRPMWLGGFMTVANGKLVSAEPTIQSAALAEALVEGCRVARVKGDLERYPRYQRAATAALQFVSTLQYSEANTGHFADGYRPTLLGGFHASRVDGTLRIDFTQQAVCAMMRYQAMATD
jgi:hypothetical protein